MTDTTAVDILWGHVNDGQYENGFRQGIRLELV